MTNTTLTILESKKKEFELIFGLHKTEQDGYGYLGFRPTTTVEDVFNWIITNFQPKDEK